MAEEVAANQKSRRNITIEITNVTTNYFLINPKVYMDSGESHIPPQPTVRPCQTVVCNFTKTSAKASGAVGVITYDLHPLNARYHSEMVAIMFSVPYDHNLYENWFSVGIYGRDKECNEALYKEMYYDKDQKSFVREKANGGGITYEGSNLDIKASMSPLGRAIMKVEIWEKLFGPQRQQRH